MIHQPAHDILSDHGLPTYSALASGSDRTPREVHAARTILAVQGLIVLAAGILLTMEPDPELPAALGIISIVEGALRVAAAGLLRRGARVTRQVVVVFAVICAVVGFASGGISIIGGLLSVAVVRCLSTEAAKRHFAA